MHVTFFSTLCYEVVLIKYQALERINMKSTCFRLVFFLIALTSSLLAKDDVVICTIFKNEAPFLKEWIEFHLLQGVKHFYMYNNNSEDNFKEVLKPYIDKNIVTLIDWLYTFEDLDHDRWIQIQTGSYMDCIKKYGDQFEWMAAIDADEFLFCPKGTKLGEFLKDYRQYGGVAVNWLKFGTSDVEDFAPNTLMIEVLTRCQKHLHPQHTFVKSIVQPKYVTQCLHAHSFKYVKGKFAVNAEGEKVSGTRSSTIHHKKIRINHYWSRSKKYLNEEKIPDRLRRRQWTLERVLRECAEFEKAEDTVILPFVEPLRQRMGYPAKAA